MTEPLIETENPIETIENASSNEGGEEVIGAVLSSVKKVGVVPKVERKIRKRKADEAALQIDTEIKKEEKPPVKYVGETSRSGYERINEHFKDFKNLSSQSHMLKHFIETHKNMKI